MKHCQPHNVKTYLLCLRCCLIVKLCKPSHVINNSQNCHSFIFSNDDSLLLCVVSKKFSEWYQKTNKTEDTNKLTLLAFKIIAILHYTLLATFIKLLETVSKGLFKNHSQNQSHVLGFPPRLRNVRLS
jgi:hypothetical protein